MERFPNSEPSGSGLDGKEISKKRKKTNKLTTAALLALLGVGGAAAPAEAGSRGAGERAAGETRQDSSLNVEERENSESQMMAVLENILRREDGGRLFGNFLEEMEKEGLALADLEEEGLVRFSEEAARDFENLSLKEQLESIIWFWAHTPSENLNWDQSGPTETGEDSDDKEVVAVKWLEAMPKGFLEDLKSEAEQVVRDYVAWKTGKSHSMAAGRREFEYSLRILWSKTLDKGYDADVLFGSRDLGSEEERELIDYLRQVGALDEVESTPM